jgi:hypothetical protein
MAEIKALTNHKKAFDEYKEKLETLNAELIAKIESLPENPRITRIDKNCFTIGIHDLGTVNWTPFYHDFTHQYKFLRAVIEHYDVEMTEKIFKEIMANGTFRLNTKLTTIDRYEFQGKTLYWFHPDVIALMRSNLC